MQSIMIGASTDYRRAQVFTRGSRRFGIFENEIAAIVDSQSIAPLPHAPASVLGVTGIHGRMLTVLDVARMGEPAASEIEPVPPFKIIALRGDEQLALAADELGENISVSSNSNRDSRELALTVIEDGDGELTVLNVSELFANAIQGRERRRRRF